MSQAPKTLWTRNFRLITLANILSAIGGEAMNLPISLYVFDQTQSTWLASIILACGILPDIFLPVIVAPFIDRSSKKAWILTLDLLMALIFMAAGFWVATQDFEYLIYAGGTLLLGTISVFYRLAAEAWMPDLIPIGFEQKGYAVMSTIYPFVIITMAPIATFLYEYTSLSLIFFLVAALTLLSVLLESAIRVPASVKMVKYNFAQYRSDLVEGLNYIRKEKGIRNIYSFMSISIGSGMGVDLMTQTFFQTTAWLSVGMLGLLKSAEMIGRGLAGLLQYKKEIPVEKRYPLTKLVYSVYNTMDGLLLFLPYPLMLANRFICGLLGTTSGTIRYAAVQSYLPAEMRARVNGFFNTIFSLGMIAFQLLAGFLGGFLSYPLVSVVLSVIVLVSMYFLIFIPKKENRPIYEAVRSETLPESVEA